MVSIIICSRSTQLLASVKQNIADNIGVEYEIIAIDNSENKYGICEAYNVGAKESKFDTLCFMHEDIFIHTINWGEIVIEILENKTIGVIGVAGGTVQLAAPAGWGAAGWDVTRINVIHATDAQYKNLDYNNPLNVSVDRVAAVDGLWMCCRKEVWQQFNFDSESFPGFHFYDIDFCVRVAAKYANYVTYGVLIEHSSLGTFDGKWYKFAISFYKKRKKLLPLVADKSLTPGDLKDKALRHWHYLLFLLKRDNLVSRRDFAYCVIECLKLDPLNQDTLWIVKDYIKSLVNKAV